MPGKIGSKTKELWKNPDYRRRMSEAHKGQKPSLKQRESARKLFKFNNPMRLQKNKDKMSKMMSVIRKGKKASLETKLKMSKSYNRNVIRTKGMKFTDETKKKMSMSHKGEKTWNWKGGVSYIKSPLRYGDDWDNVRKLVYERDGWICQKCKQHKPLDVHHKIPFLESFDNSISNLISLCRSCHIKEEMKLLKERRCQIHL